ncbi:MAG: hypothetical protein HC799_09840, partial [Limnothrix sp. RL_2_0]|nr:hypothetical protein [Limnothrix sp. RL_2_0]
MNNATFFSHGLANALVALPLANSGVPLFTTNISLQIILLIPICLIELLVHRQILKTSLLKSARISITSNVWSTLLGFLLIFLFAALGMSEQFAAPIQDDGLGLLGDWIIMRLLGLLLMWLLSIWSEQRVSSRLIKAIGKKQQWQSFVWANTLSY